MANLFDERFHAYAWNAVGYWPPQPSPMDIDALIEQLKEQTGDPRYGYWKFFNLDDAHVVCDQNVSAPCCVPRPAINRSRIQIDSFLQLVYPEPPELWLEWLTPVGKCQQWVEENRTTGIPSWLTQDVSVISPEMTSVS